MKYRYTYIILKIMSPIKKLYKMPHKCYVKLYIQVYLRKHIYRIKSWIAREIVPVARKLDIESHSAWIYIWCV